MLDARIKKITKLVDQSFWFCVLIMSGIVLWLNYDAKAMSGILPYYHDFKHIISCRFQLSEVHLMMNNPTFPMWGYGWVFLITENKFLVLAIQEGLAIFSLWFVIRFIKNRAGVPLDTVIFIKLLIVICIPWYAFHSVLWPYSFAVSFLMISFVLFVQTFEQNDRPTIFKTIFAGIFWGLALNFRSDYVYLPLAMVVLIILLDGLNKIVIMKSLCFLLGIFLALLPWMVYTKSVTGKFRFTSSNLGHVLFVGLGELPNNKWGITFNDEDPKMHALVQKHFGPGINSLSWQADDFLKKAFGEEVKAEPLEYVHKCLHGLRLVLTWGFYPGEFFDSDLSSVFRKEFAAAPRKFISTHGLEFWRFYLRVFSSFYGLCVLLLSCLLLPVTVFHAINQKDLFLLVVFLGIAYQICIGIFANHLHIYSSNMLLFHIINAGIGIVLIKGWWINKKFHNANH